MHGSYNNLHTLPLGESELLYVCTGSSLATVWSTLAVAARETASCLLAFSERLTTDIIFVYTFTIKLVTEFNSFVHQRSEKSESKALWDYSINFHHLLNSKTCGFALSSV